jgi:hypothetical protein
MRRPGAARHARACIANMLALCVCIRFDIVPDPGECRRTGNIANQRRGTRKIAFLP